MLGGEGLAGIWKGKEDVLLGLDIRVSVKSEPPIHPPAFVVGQHNLYVVRPLACKEESALRSGV